MEEEKVGNVWEMEVAEIVSCSRTGGWPWQVATVSLYLHEGAQDFPGFLVELLSIPPRVECLQFLGQPVVLAEKEGVGHGQQNLLRGSGISYKPRRQEGEAIST